MVRSLTLVTFVLSALRTVLSSPCLAFDADFNLLAFGFHGKDYNTGTQDTWTASQKATDITKSGRPPFDGSSTTCYLSQFSNAIYVMGADSSAPSAVHIYDATSKSWSTQTVNTGPFDPRSFDAILDHDTNVFYALSHGGLYLLDMGSLKAATSSALSWTDVRKAPFPDNYQPVMALAQNHIHFLNVPGLPAGSADIFVIHFSYFQPDPQSYPASDGNSFPNAHGQTASFFRSKTVQEEFAFIPDDFSSTYIVNVQTNTTQAFPAPPSKDPKAIYAAGITSLVQLDSNGAVAFLPYTSGTTASSGWSTVQRLAITSPPGAIGQSPAAQNTSGTPDGQTPGTSQGQKNGGTQTVSKWKVAGLATTVCAMGVLSIFI